MTDNRYDPDAFDWDGPAGINLDEIAPDIVEQAVQAALNVQEEKYGWRYCRRSERKEGAGRLFRVKYYMPEEKRAFFEENFPGYTFIWDGALGHHDHPCAHLCTELNEIEMVTEMIDSGEQYIDLFGNGKRDARYKRNCVNLYTLATPKDYLRYQKPTARDVLYDEDALCDPTTTLGKIDRVTLTHALYYLSMEQIGRIANTRNTRKISALIHRHKETHGFLNSGEQEYWVSEVGQVEQVNVSTGEKYVHPSLEALFHQGSAKTQYGGVAWTIRQVGGDSYIVDFVACPNGICEKFIPLRFLQPESWEEYTYNSVSVKRFLHWTWMTATTSQGVIRLEDMDLFNKLRRYVAGKQRTPRLKTETMNYARRMCNKADIMAIHGGGAHDIPVASMAEYVEVSTYVDVKSELDAAISFYKENAKMVTALNLYYEKGSTPADFTMVTGAVVKSGKIFSEAAIRVIQHVRDSQEMPVDEWVKKNLPDGDLAERLMREPGGADGKLPGPWW